METEQNSSSKCKLKSSPRQSNSNRSNNKCSKIKRGRQSKMSQKVTEVRVKSLSTVVKEKTSHPQRGQSLNQVKMSVM